MQAKLHWWATRDPGRVFDDLHNLVCDPAFLMMAWDRVRGNKGGRTAGVDGVVPRSIPKESTALLADLRNALRDRSFRPVPVRERLIPKPGNVKKRRLGIPTVSDRIVQASLKLVLEPIFEADFQPFSYGFRPRRGAHDAIAEIHDLGSKGYRWVLEADIEACFDMIDHTALLARFSSRIVDKRVVALVKSFLKAGVLTEEGLNRDTVTGTPQGGILSPLLANIALSVLDDHYQHKWDSITDGGNASQAKYRRMRLRRNGGATYRLVRYADDFVVLVFGTESHAEQARIEVAQVLAPMGLRLSEAKTRVVHMDQGFDFLGWHLQRRTKRGTTRKVIYTYPSKKALASIVGKVRHITRRSGSPYVSLQALLQHLNPVLRGWGNYFRHGSSKATLDYLANYSWTKVIRWLRQRHPRLTWRKIKRRYSVPGYPGPVEKWDRVVQPRDATDRVRQTSRGYRDTMERSRGTAGNTRISMTSMESPLR